MVPVDIFRFVEEHPPTADDYDRYGYQAARYDALEALGFTATDEEFTALGKAFEIAKGTGGQSESDDDDDEPAARGMTETDAAEIAAEKGWTLVPNWKYDKTADRSHKPKGKVYTDGKSFYGADNTGHVGFAFKKWTGAARKLAYAGNVTPDKPDDVIARGKQRKKKKKK